MFGVRQFDAIINPPQVAILAIGAMEERPVVRAGVLAIGHRVTVTLSSDHRVVDGADAAAFLATLRDVVANTAAGD
jgi:pyruvate dehydrogenase E2 component (dihydrolipoamide acetyltransferase)